MVHLFAAFPIKDDRKVAPGQYDGRRFFARVIVRHVDSGLITPRDDFKLGIAMHSISLDDLDAHPETEVAFVEALNSLEVAIGSESSKWRHNSIFLNVLVEAAVDLRYIEAVIRMLAKRYAEKIRRLQVDSVEFVIHNRPPGATEAVPLRFVCWNPTGAVLNVDVYAQHRENDKTVLRSLHPRRKGALDGQDVNTPYAVRVPLEEQRESAEALETTYVYDFITLFEKVLSQIWKQHSAQLRVSQGDGGGSDAVLESKLHSVTEMSSPIPHESDAAQRLLKMDEELEHQQAGATPTHKLDADGGNGSNNNNNNNNSSSSNSST